MKSYLCFCPALVLLAPFGMQHSFNLASGKCCQPRWRDLAFIMKGPYKSQVRSTEMACAIPLWVTKRKRLFLKQHSARLEHSCVSTVRQILKQVLCSDMIDWPKSLQAWANRLFFQLEDAVGELPVSSSKDNHTWARFLYPLQGSYILCEQKKPLKPQRGATTDYVNYPALSMTWTPMYKVLSNPDMGGQGRLQQISSSKERANSSITLLSLRFFQFM